jgi:hypothetical protein
MPLKQVLAQRLSAAEELTAELREALIQIHQLRQTMANCEAERDRCRNTLATLMRNIGAADSCAGCRAPILWVRHRNQVAAPYNPDGVPHFATCPKADQFRKKGR